MVTEMRSSKAKIHSATPCNTPIMGAMAGGDNRKCALMIARYSTGVCNPGTMAAAA